MNIVDYRTILKNTHSYLNVVTFSTETPLFKSIDCRQGSSYYGEMLHHIYEPSTKTRFKLNHNDGQLDRFTLRYDAQIIRYFDKFKHLLCEDDSLKTITFLCDRIDYYEDELSKFNKVLFKSPRGIDKEIKLNKYLDKIEVCGNKLVVDITFDEEVVSMYDKPEFNKSVNLDEGFDELYGLKSLNLPILFKDNYIEVLSHFNYTLNSDKDKFVLPLNSSMKLKSIKPTIINISQYGNELHITITNKYMTKVMIFGFLYT